MKFYLDDDRKNFQTAISDVWLLSFLYLNLLDLYNISFVCRKFKFLVRSFKRYRKYFQMSNKIISTITWSCVLDNQFQNFYLRMSDYEKYFKFYVNFYFIPKLKHNISLQNGLAHMLFL